MGESKSPISGATSYEEMGEFWDEHSLDEFWDQTEPANFDVQITSHAYYFALDEKLMVQAKEIAAKRGISTETLLNLWIQEKLQQEPNSSAAD